MTFDALLTQILSAVGFDDDDIAFLHLKAGVLEQIEEIDARALEADDVELLLWTTSQPREVGGGPGWIARRLITDTTLTLICRDRDVGDFVFVRNAKRTALLVLVVVLHIVEVFDASCSLGIQKRDAPRDGGGGRVSQIYLHLEWLLSPFVSDDYEIGFLSSSIDMKAWDPIVR